MVGRKVAIVSDKPQTTRRAIRGVADARRRASDRAHRPARRAAPARRADARACSTASSRSSRDADAALFVVNGEQGVGGPGDRWIAEALHGASVPVVDRGQQGRPPRPPAHRAGAAGGRQTSGSTPRSSRSPRRTGRGVPPLVDHLAGAAARGPVLLPARGDLRPARARAAGRARARAGAAPHAPGAAARRRGAGRGDRGRASDLVDRPRARCGSRPSPRRAS